MIERGRICWLEAARSAARRPVVVLQSDAFNRSVLPTVLVAPLAQNLRLLEAPGNVLVPAKASGLSQDTVVVVSEIATIPRSQLTPAGTRLPSELVRRIGEGVKLALGV